MDKIRVHSVLSSHDGKLFGKVDEHSLGTWKDFSTTLGIDQATFQMGLQQGIDHYVGIANAALTAGVVIPSVAGITVSDVSIIFKAGLLEFGASVIPPHFASELVAAYRWLKDEVMFCN